MKREVCLASATWSLSSVVEQSAHNRSVGGSNPSGTTTRFFAKKESIRLLFTVHAGLVCPCADCFGHLVEFDLGRLGLTVDGSPSTAPPSVDKNCVSDGEPTVFEPTVFAGLVCPCQIGLGTSRRLIWALIVFATFRRQKLCRSDKSMTTPYGFIDCHSNRLPDHRWSAIAIVEGQPNALWRVTASDDTHKETR